MRRKFLSLILSGVIVLSMAGCSVDTGTTSGDKKTQDTAKKSGETLTVMIGSDDGGGVAVKSALDKAAEIMGINLEYSVFPADQFLNVLNTKGATGNLDDLIFTSYSLSDLPYNEFEALDGEWKNQISDTTEPFTINPETGDTVFAPFGAESNFGFAYNKEVLEKAGVELPIADYKSFVEACKKVKETGVTPLYISAQENWTPQILLLTSFTTTLMKDNLVDKLITNQVKPQDTESIVKIWDNVYSLQEEEILNEDYKSASHDMGKKALAEGKAAFYAVTDAAYGEIKTEYPDLVDGIGMTTVPMWDNADDAFVMTHRSARCIAVSKNSSHLELAKEFVDTCITEEVMNTYYEASPGAAPYKDLGFEVPMSPWNEEMQSLAETLPNYDDWCNGLYDGEPKLNPFFGDFDLKVQSMFTGKTAEEAVTEWYTKYSEDAKAKRVDGF